jgi:hypothetical protein
MRTEDDVPPALPATLDPESVRPIVPRMLATFLGTIDSFVHAPNGLYVIAADGSYLTLVIGGSGFKSSPEWWR